MTHRQYRHPNIKRAIFSRGKGKTVLSYHWISVILRKPGFLPLLVQKLTIKVREMQTASARSTDGFWFSSNMEVSAVLQTMTIAPCWGNYGRGDTSRFIRWDEDWKSLTSYFNVRWRHVDNDINEELLHSLKIDNHETIIRFCWIQAIGQGVTSSWTEKKQSIRWL